ncbi:MAG: tRNA (adenosine(37)-N6)-threonylcarbamoyltransferase complex ATPase subunit type 1 TsaE [Nocardioides sp.]|uniref:tRNA (adenosine(37)-N6)-threonylcarbamoyltransferase complex ATPase subunit type 1 TsaE n=1 Tax=Nocardioides sp. TaxID=35761 RepID=UPI003F11A4B8
MTVDVRLVGAEHADEVWAVVRAAFDARAPLDPPADAMSDDLGTFTRALADHGGLLASVDGVAQGALLLDPGPDGLVLRRFGVRPEVQGRGIATAMVEAAAEVAVGHDALVVQARQELPRTVGFWEDHGFVEVSRHHPYVELRRPLARTVEVPDADAMRGLGRRVGRSLRAGDLVVLTGELGAGKTTFTQGLGEGLGVRGGVTSPTFVIARVHPSLVGGPDLVHVDAYRLGGLAELDDLDLDTSLDDAVTVVEWGAGLAEQLAEGRLEVVIERALGLGDHVGAGLVTDGGSGDGATAADAQPDGDADHDEVLDPRRVHLRRVLPE